MLKNLRFPLLYVLEAVLAVPLFVGFAALVPFVASRPLSDLDLHGKSLPAEWEAAVFNHGRFLRGYLIGNHPAAFTGILVLFLATGALLARISWLRAMQSRSDQPARMQAHKLANLAVLAVWIVLAYLLAQHMTGVSPT